MREPTLTAAAITSLLLVALPVCGRAAENPPVANQTVAARVSPERVTGDLALENDQVSQFLGADAKGRVFLLHGDTLAVDQIPPSGKVVSFRAPQGKEGSDAEVGNAALSPDGSSWLLASGLDKLSLLSSDELRELPTPHWWVSSFTYTTDGPILAVLPFWVGGEDAASKVAWDKPPFLLQLDGQAWKTLSMQDAPKLISEKPPVMPSFVDIKAERDVKLAVGRNGALWSAQQNSYLLKRYSRQGAVEESVTVSGAHVEWKERTEEEWQAVDKALGRKANRSNKMVAIRVVRGLTAQGNRVYQVVATPEGVALDRWDDDTQTLDRLLLDGIAPGPGYLDLAAGRDGLYIAERRLGAPVWRLDWQRLEEARWKAVPETVAQRPRKQ